MKGWGCRDQSPPVYFNETLRHPPLHNRHRGGAAPTSTPRSGALSRFPTDTPAIISVKDFRPRSPFGRTLGAGLFATVSAALVATGPRRWGVLGVWARGAVGNPQNSEKQAKPAFQPLNSQRISAICENRWQGALGGQLATTPDLELNKGFLKRVTL